MVVVGHWPYRARDFPAKHIVAGFSCPDDSEVEIARVNPNPEYTSLVSLAHDHLGPALGHCVLTTVWGKTQFIPDRYRFSDSRGYCEVYQEISQILIKYPVTTGISQGMADGLTLRS